MEKVFTLLTALAIPLLGLGADYSIRHCDRHGNVYHRLSNLDAEMMETPDYPRFSTPPLKEEEDYEWITLNVKFVYPEWLTPYDVDYTEQAMGWYTYWEGQDEVTLEIPKGFYGDIICGAFRSNEKAENPNEWYHYLVRLPEMADGMEVVIDGYSITDNYRLELFTPEGKPITVKHGLYDSQTGEATYDEPGAYNPFTGEITFDEEGAVEEVFGDICVFEPEGAGRVYKDFFIRFRSYTDGQPTKVWKIPVLHINPLPEGMGITGTAIACQSKSEWWFLQSNTARTPEIFCNDPENYKKTSLTYAYTPFSDGKPRGTKYCVEGTLDGWIAYEYGFGYNLKEGDSYSSEILMCVPDVSMVGIDKAKICGSFFTWALGDEEENIASQLFTVREGEIQYIPHNITMGGNYGYNGDLYSQMLSNIAHSDMFQKVNPYLVLPLEDVMYRMGNSAPVLTSLCTWDPEDGEIPDFFIDDILDMGILSFGYSGRAGESMLVDDFTMEIESTRNGNLLEYYLDNFNVSVDGEIPGSNRTHIGMNVGEADCVPPTLQTLQFRNRSSHMTDRFENAEDGEFSFYAGDFQIEYDENYIYSMMGVKPMSEISMSYAPFGSEDFTELTIRENPDKFFMPGYGYCFEGSLESVDQMSPNGWFDVRISLKDESGNSQTQTISPAFYIASLSSGVKQMNEKDYQLLFSDGKIVSTDGNPVSVYSIDGKPVLNEFLPAGIYIVKQGLKAHKYIIH